MTTLSEFEIIRRYFTDLVFPSCNIVLGVGDDAAIIHVPETHELVFSIDTQNIDVHFPANANPEWIAQRAFRCAISDLAAMGAEPLCFTLALTLPSADERWLADFSRGLKNVAKEFSCSLVGGDTTKGSLSITLQVHGLVPKGMALKRSGARINDIIFVSGYLGNSAAYVKLLHEKKLTEKSLSHCVELFEQSYFFPRPKITLGKSLRERAHSAIDISDGLLADLGHICQRSNVCAEINIDKLPLIPEMKKTFGAEAAIQLALIGGDDYELCFTVPENRCRKILSLCEDMECGITAIGKIIPALADAAIKPESRITCYHSDGRMFDHNALPSRGYTHF